MQANGIILQRVPLTALPHNGNLVVNSIDTAHRLSTLSLGVTATLTWDGCLGPALSEENRPYPLLLIGSTMESDVDFASFIGAGIELVFFEKLDWTKDKNFLLIHGKDTGIALPLSELFPYLRLSNVGALLIAFATSQTLTLVEYNFSRKDFLEIAELIAADDVDDDVLSFENWARQQGIWQVSGTTFCKPLLLLEDPLERY